MPELGEQMYSSQQICIPPTFPYLLRQFAKAAIRTQPNDLLKWSTTYFRCLSLNIPPPVKPRLEYPIPKDFNGLTPGWLRALIHQMTGNTTVTFKTLWDRWIGACLQHEHLIQILCLGGFTDNQAVPWLQFIALCAAHLTENLTQTMILICEILSEEPEGGSAMISYTTFIELYTFLSQIDASVPQTLRNYYFLDKFLELYEEKIVAAREVKEKAERAEVTVSIDATLSETTTETAPKEHTDDGSDVSCPSVPSQDPDNFMKLLRKIQETDGEGEEEEGFSKDIKESGVPEEIDPGLEQPKQVEIRGEDESDQVSETSKTSKISEQLAIDEKLEIVEDADVDAVSKSTKLSESDGSDKKDSDSQEGLMEDLERLKLLQLELYGEDDEELEKYKKSILAQAPLTESQVLAKQHYDETLKVDDVTTSCPSIKSSVSLTSDKPDAEKPADEPEYEEVHIDRILGIGSKVPEDLVNVVLAYVEFVAKIQQNMFMPRNVRHYECPPFHADDY